MRPSFNSAAEILEARIAPAGLVTVTFLNGTLNIDGSDGLDHNVEVVKTGLNQFRVDGVATGINELGQMTKSFEGVLLNVVIAGGLGADTFKLTNLQPLKSLQFDGGAGADSLSAAKLKTRAGGAVEINLGSESGTVDFSGKRTILHGALNLDLGGGGTANFGSVFTKVDGDVVISGGAGSDAVSVTGASAVFKSKLSFTGGDGNDSFNATGTSLKLKGLVTMEGGAGTDSFVFGADTNKFAKSTAPGLVDLKLGSGPGTVSFLGNSTSVFGDLKIDLGSGDGAAQLNSTVNAVSGSLLVTGGAGNDSVGLSGSTSIGGNLSFAGDTGDDVLTAKGSLLTVAGATSMDAGSGTSIFDLNVIAIALGSLSVTGGTLNDLVSINADGTISGDVNLQLGMDGTGPSTTLLESRAGIANGLQFGGALTIDMVGATVDFLTIANIQVAKAFVAQTGENVSTVSIANLNVKSNFRLQTGSGADVVNIDNIRSRDFDVDTESGADELRIERNATYAGSSMVKGIATILTGIGADQIRIGNSSDAANLKVSFMDAMTLDAGDGANMRNDIVASNFFKVAPTIVATGGTLTQTEAA